MDYVLRGLEGRGGMVVVHVAPVRFPMRFDCARGPAVMGSLRTYKRLRDGQNRVVRPWRVRAVGAGVYADASAMETLLAALDYLVSRRTEDQKFAVRMMRDGYTCAQAAKVLGITESAVARRLQRAGWRLERRLVRLASETLERMLRKLAVRSDVESHELWYRFTASQCDRRVFGVHD
jgi:hypothetical protein